MQIMRKIFFILILTNVLFALCSVAQNNPLIPFPVHYKMQAGQFLLNGSTRILAPDSSAWSGGESVLTRTLKDFTGLSLHRMPAEKATRSGNHQPGQNYIQLTIDSL